MSSMILPKPFTAYVGLLASTFEQAADTLRNPASVTRIPLLAMSTLMAPRERYEELAERGEHILHGVLGHLGGSSGGARRGAGRRSPVNQVQARAAARLAEAEDKLEERAGGVVTRLQDAADQATKAGQKVTGGPAGPIGTTARVVAGAAGRTADRVERAAEAVQPVVEQAGQAAQAVTSTTGQAVQAVTSTTGDAVQEVTSAAGEAVQALASATGHAAQAASSAAGQAAQATIGAVGQAAQTATSTAGQVVQTTTTVTEQAAQTATSTAGQVVQAATDATGQAVHAATAATGQAQQAAEQLAAPPVDQSAAPAPTETLWAEVAAPPTTDRGAIDDAPAAGGPNAAEAAAPSTRVTPAEMQQGAPETRPADPKAELRAEAAAAPTMDREAIVSAVSAVSAATPTAETAEHTPTPPIPPAARKAAAKAARKAATKATPAKRVMPPPSPGIAPAAPESTLAGTDSTPVTANNAGVVAAAVGMTPEVAPAVPSGHRDGIDVPAQIREAAGPLREHSDLPLADFDHMTLGSLRGRLRTLDAVGLVQLLDYEQAHAARLPILALLQNRLRKVLAD